MKFISVVVLLILFGGCRSSNEVAQVESVEIICGEPFDDLNLLIDSVGYETIRHLIKNDSFQGIELAYLTYQIGKFNYTDDNEQVALFQLALEQFKQSTPVAVELIGRLCKNLSSGARGTPYERSKLTLDGIRHLVKYDDSCTYASELLPELHLYAARAFLEQDDISSAMHFARTGLEYAQRDSAMYFSHANLYRILAQSQLALGDFDAAQEMILAAEDHMEVMDEDDEFDAGDYANICDIRQSWARYTNNELGAWQAAQRAHTLRRKFSHNEDLFAHSCNNLGRLYHLKGDHDKGNELISQALDLYTRVGATTSKGTCYESQAMGALLSGDTLATLDHLDHAFAAYHDNPTQASVFGAMDKAELRDPLFTKAKILARLHASQPAEFTLKQLLSTVAQLDSVNYVLRNSVRTEGSKILIVRQTRQLYGALLALFDRKYNQTQDEKYADLMQSFLERGKASVLRERRARSVLRPAADNKQFAKLSKLREDLSNAKLVLANNEDINQVQRLKSEYLRLEQLLWDAQEEIYEPTNNEEILLDKEQMALAVLVEDLSPEAAILDYFMGENAVYVSVGLEGRVRTKKLSIHPDALSDKIDQFNAAIEARNKGRWISSVSFRDQQLDLLSTNGQELYQQLIVEAFGETPPLEQLVIIPDGKISQLPFSTLLTEKATGELGQWPFALHQHRISYHFSAPIWLDQKERGQYKGKSALIVAPEQKELGSLLSPLGDEILLSPLGTSTEEAEVVEQILPVASRKLLKDKATRIKEITDFSSYGILHFAGHGVALPQSAQHSFLVLEFPEDSIQAPQLFTVAELEERNLVVELLVLSACQTHAGTLVQEEGIISLARAGITAGANSVVASFWAVRQADKPLFFTTFYAALVAGDDRDVAIQKAQLAVLEDGEDAAHPFYWAAFQNFGLNEPIEMINSR